MGTSSISDFLATVEIDPILSEHSFDIGIEGEDYLDNNTNHFETFNPEHGEHQPGFPWVDFESSPSQTYVENCPYNKNEALDNVSVVRKKFRLVEEFSSGLVYIGDSYGSHSYIDANEGRACPQSCFCWSHDQAPGIFTFIAHKSSSRLIVNIYSDALYSEVIKVIGPENMEEEVLGKDGPLKSLDGFCLIQSVQNLLVHLHRLRCDPFDSVLSSVISEMDLLVHGFLADGDVFKSFGFEYLYENGYLTFEQWKAFQQDQLQRDITSLDERFIATDESEDFEDFDDPPYDEQLFGVPSETFEASEIQQDENLTSSPTSARYCVSRVDTQEGDSSVFAPSRDMYLTESKWVLAKKLLASVSSGREEAVKKILDQGAEANGYPRWTFHGEPLLAAARAGHEEIVQLLLNRGALDIDFALIRAASAGHAAVVSLLLGHDHGMNHSVKKAFCYIGGMVVGLESEKDWESESQNRVTRNIRVLYDNWIEVRTGPWIKRKAELLCHNKGQGLVVASDIALIEAAAAGHEEVVKILLDSGTTSEGAHMLYTKNVAWVRGQKIPVVEAAKAGHGAVVRLLLQRGAVVSSLQPLMSPCITTKEGRTFRRLNRRFIQQYRLMTEAMLDSSAEFSQLGTRFLNHREAWSAGINTMRRLCNGKPPRGLQNTIAFLCISRAMSETLDSTNDTDYVSQFDEDLERWQVIFKPEELGVYRELIHSMWGTVLSEKTSKSWKASDFLTLTHFQALLSTLIRQSNEPVNIYGPHNQSLRCSQQTFIARNHQASAEPEVDLPTANSGSSDSFDPQPPDCIEPKPPDISIAPKKTSLEEHIKNDISTCFLDAIVVLLMAGAIFAIVVIFLQWLRDFFNCISHKAEIRDLKDKCQVLTTYLGLKTHYAMPSAAFTETRSVGSINMLSSMDQIDSPKQSENVFNPAGGSSLMHFSDPSSEQRTNWDELEFSQQGAFSSPHTSAVYNILLSTSNHDIAMSSLVSGPQISPSLQYSAPTSTKPSQKPRRTCPTCRKTVLATNLKRHLKDHTGENKVNCSFCGKSIGRKEYLLKHERERCPLRHVNKNSSR